MHRTVVIKFVLLYMIFPSIRATLNENIEAKEPVRKLFKLEGTVHPPGSQSLTNWQMKTRILINGGDIVGFVRQDGDFVINNVYAGSYLVEIINPDYKYEPATVEITEEGEFLAKTVNYVEEKLGSELVYPLVMKPVVPFQYFEKRGTWKYRDLIFHPTVLLMAMSIVLLTIIPNMSQDPAAWREMQKINKFKHEMPTMSEMINTFFGESQKERDHLLIIRRAELAWNINEKIIDPSQNKLMVCSSST